MKSDIHTLGTKILLRDSFLRSTDKDFASFQRWHTTKSHKFAQVRKALMRKLFN